MATTTRRETIAVSAYRARGALDVIDSLIDRGQLAQAEERAGVAIAEAEEVQTQLLELARELRERAPRSN